MVRFTAYAFNRDRVKGETVGTDYRVPDDVPAIRSPVRYVNRTFTAWPRPD
jgi:hypothetical protein